MTAPPAPGVNKGGRCLKQRNLNKRPTEKRPTPLYSIELVRPPTIAV